MLTTIGSYSFYKCSKLTGNIIQKLENSNIKSIGAYAFYGCDGLTGELKLFDNISMGAMTLAGCSKISGDINTLLAEGLTEIPDGAFSGMSGLTGTPNIPETVTRIGDYAFYMCSGLTGTLTIPSVCVSIGNYAFYKCTGFNLLSIDDSSNGKLNSIGESAFYGCSGFAKEKLSFPNTLEEIGAYCFSYSFGSGVDVEIPSSVLNLRGDTFSWSGIKSIKFPSTLETIEGSCFRNSGLAGDLVFPSSLKSIGMTAFYGTLITSVTFNDNMTYVDSSCFGGCRYLSTVNFSSVKTINSYAFANCIALTKVLFPTTIKTISSWAFLGCTNLDFKIVKYNEDGTEKSSEITTNVIEYLENYTNITSIDGNAFKNCTKLTGTFYNKLTTQGGTCKLGSTIFSGTGVVVTVDLTDGLVVNKDGTTYSIKDNAYTGATLLTGKVDLGNIKLKDGSTATITSVGNSAFRGCTGITEIVIPDTVTSIGNYAFCDCSSLTSIKLPKNSDFKLLSSYVLAGCSSLKNITIPSSVTSYGGYVFSESAIESLNIPNGPTGFGSENTFRNMYYCSYVNLPSSVTKLDSCTFVYLGSRLDDSAEITINGLEKVTYIGSNCFTYSNLKKISLNNVTWIGESAFKDCSMLNEITIKGKVTSIGAYAFKNCTSLTKTNFDDLSLLGTIGDEAFYNCTSLNTILYLPSTISIGKDAFRDSDGNKLSGISINYIN
jgi:hypothetical protein